MATKTTASKHSPAAAQQYTTGFVTAPDGVTIGYRQLGHGPGVVLLHGAMESAASHMQLATALADAFTVYVPDRRGRGLSGPYNKEYSIQSDVADMDALLAKTGAHNVFGVSSGADIWLEAALSLPAIQKAALYEPAIFSDASEPQAFLTRFDREMAQRKVAAAMVTAMKGAQMGPPIFNAMPRWLMESLTNSMMKGEKKKAKTGDITMATLAPTLHYDFALVTAMSGHFQDFKKISAEVLLLGGSKSPAYLKNALRALEKVLPHVAGRIEFPGLDHGGSSDVSNTNRNGNPELVARELRRFFAEP
jgi:pimeloyl-ACP methyl ester carboxylesterase